MPIQSSGVTVNAAVLSARLLEELELLPRARILAKALAEAVPDSVVNVYVAPALSDFDAWTVLATVGDSAVAEATVPVVTGPLGISAWVLQPLICEGTT